METNSVTILRRQRDLLNNMTKERARELLEAFDWLLDAKQSYPLTAIGVRILEHFLEPAVNWATLITKE